MNIEFVDNTKENKMTMIVSLGRRKFAREPRVLFKWKDAEKYLKENYVPPKNYSLGECEDKIRIADNDSDRIHTMEWVFNLMPFKATAKKPADKKSTRQK